MPLANGMIEFSVEFQEKCPKEMAKYIYSPERALAGKI